MNKILYTICAGSLALALNASGQTTLETKGHVGKKASARVTGEAKTSTATKTNVNTAATVRTNRSVGRNYTVKSGTNANASVNRNVERNNRVRTMNESRVTNRNRVRANENMDVKTNRAYSVNRARNMEVNRNRDLNVNRTRNAELNRNRNVSVNRTREINNRNVTVNRTRNVNRNVVVTNNWRGSRFAGTRYAAFRNYHREFHNRDWWHSHYSNVVLIGGGWWAWNAGYWYPAWGYDSAYSYYPYDGPIYTGRAARSPVNVTMNVQAQLQRDGYYDGPIDGLLGPATRQAIADFQADNGLAVTASIDEPTLDELGVA